MTIKICGITRVEDALFACGLGVQALGFVFWGRSPRAISPGRAMSIIDALPPFVVPVGVFVDPEAGLLEECRDAGIQVAQIVGQVPPLPRGMRLLRVVTLSPDGHDVIPEVPGHSAILVDAHDPVKRGGTGTTIEWDTVAAIAARRPVVLAGGLRSENVAEAIRRARPAAVDVSSGVEVAPGIKDHGRIAAFVAAAREWHEQ